MQRTIPISKLKEAISEAYNSFSTITDGAVDPRAEGEDPSKFAIAAVLTDGTTIEVGDSKIASPMGSIAKVPILTTLFTQVAPDAMPDKFNGCCCNCGCAASKTQKPTIGVSATGVRLVSTIQPQGDPEGKMDILTSILTGMVGSEPVLDDKLYRKLIETTEQLNAVNTLAEAGFELYDDAPLAINLYAKLTALTLTPVQFAAMGATIAADGFNPLTKENIFDGSLSQHIAGFMAAKGPHKMAKPWLTNTGLPAVSSYGGTIMGVLPGAFGIAAFCPALNSKAVSIKAAKSLAYIMSKLQLSALASAKVIFTAD